MSDPPPYSEKQQYPPQKTGPYPPQKPFGYPPLKETPQKPSYGANTTTIITSQPAVGQAVPIILHEAPMSVICPSCHAQVITVVRYETGTLAWVLCGIMFCLG